MRQIILSVVIMILSCKLYASNDLCSKALEPVTGTQQIDELWSKIEELEYEQLPLITMGEEEVFSWNPISLLRIARKLRRRAFNVTSDVRNVRSTKMSHIHGPAAKVEVVITSNRFSGLFSRGNYDVIMRASFAFNPKANDRRHSFPQPGLALKFFVDGKPSKNILAMGSLDGEEESANYFHPAQSTKLKPAQGLQGKIGQKIFGHTTAHPSYLKLGHMTEYRSNGSKVSHQVTPAWVTFLPTQVAKFSGDPAAIDFRHDLLDLEVGTKIFALYGFVEHEEDQTPEVVYMGYVRTTSRFIASEFADRFLHFRHEGAPAK